MPAPAPAAMTRFSPGLPVTISATGGTAYPSSYLVSATYEELWHSDTASPTMPVWGAINVSSVSAGLLANVLVRLDFRAAGSYTSNFGTGADMATTAADWKIRAHAALNGGVPPADGDAGWVDLITVTGSAFSQRMHTLGSCQSYSWIELRITAQNGTNGLAVKVELFAAPTSGPTDTWLMLGDSTTDEGINDVDSTTALEWADHGPLQKKISAMAGGTRYPLIMAAGSGGQAMAFLATNIVGLVAPNIGCTYYGIDYGLNDANGATLSAGTLDTWEANLLSVVDYIQGLGGGRTVMLAHIQYSNVGGNQGPANATALNLRVDKVRAARPACLVGPDLYTPFSANPSLLRTDNLHPGFDSGTGGGAGGYNAWQASWRSAMWTSVYGQPFEPHKPRLRRNVIYVPQVI